MRKRLSVLAIALLYLAPFALAQDITAQLDEGKQFVDAGDYESAQFVLEKLVEEYPQSAEAQFWLGAAYGIEAQNAGRLRQMRLAGKIKSQFERAVELDPELMGAREGLIQFHLQAPRIAGGRKEVAQEHAEAMVRIDPQHGRPFLVMVQEARDDYAGAEQTLKEGVAAAATPRESAEATMRLVYFYQRREDWAAANAALQPLAASGDRAAQYQVGRTAALSGQYLTEGIAALKAYIAEYTPVDNEPSLAHANWRLGLVYQHQGERLAARDAYEAALRLDSTLSAAQEALENL